MDDRPSHWKLIHLKATVMNIKTFRFISTVSLVLVLAAALTSLAGIFYTGLYPAVFVFCMMIFIPLGSRYYVQQSSGSSPETKGLLLLGLLNILVILVVFWLSLVVIHDRVLQDCC